MVYVFAPGSYFGKMSFLTCHILSVRGGTSLPRHHVLLCFPAFVIFVLCVCVGVGFLPKRPSSIMWFG